MKKKIIIALIIGVILIVCVTISTYLIINYKKDKSLYAFLIILVCSCLIPCVFDVIQGSAIKRSELIHSFSVLLICGVGCYLSRCLPACINRSIEWCGEHSLELYVCHEAIYAYLYKLNATAYMLPFAEHIV